MNSMEIRNTIEKVLINIPDDWVKLTTHRLDIYNEEHAKTDFLEAFQSLITNDSLDRARLNALPTAYDYIRLGHPLSSVLEWALATINGLNPGNVISFASATMPVLAVLRKNHFDHIKTRIVHTGDLPDVFTSDVLRTRYEYVFETALVESTQAVSHFDGVTVFVSRKDNFDGAVLSGNIDFYVRIQPQLGSVIFINSGREDYISEVQHVRRRESVAMTPVNCVKALKLIAGRSINKISDTEVLDYRKTVEECIHNVTNTRSKVVIASSGLSTQYAIMMGLVDEAREKHPGKEIRFIVPPNCYGGTNDQARRVAAVLNGVAVVDLPVDSGKDMVESIDHILDEVAAENAIPYIIAEIPTNPRVEVPNLDKLEAVLCKARSNRQGTAAVDPVFILDQTFCPNVHFLGHGDILASMRSLAYVSGSKFPSGGRCTAGYCVANEKSQYLMDKIEYHLRLCDNGATDHQLKVLAEQMPSMNRRIAEAYKNTRAFVTYIHRVLPDAKINFVSEELASRGFTPSVFSLDLPVKGNTPEEKEAYKRSENLKLINRMIGEIPGESKYCVSYGQLKGCYWTIPATSTQGTTQEGDKDYIVRVSVSPDLDLERHKKVFCEFVENMA